MAIPPDSIRGLILFARPTNPWLLLSARLVAWTALSLLPALTSVYNADAPYGSGRSLCSPAPS